jgi:hypothetical protein
MSDLSKAQKYFKNDFKMVWETTLEQKKGN